MVEPKDEKEINIDERRWKASFVFGLATMVSAFLAVLLIGFIISPENFTVDNLRLILAKIISFDLEVYTWIVFMLCAAIFGWFISTIRFYFLNRRTGDYYINKYCKKFRIYNDID